MTYDICIHTRLSISCIAQYRGVLQRILTLDAVGLKGVWAFQNVVFGTIALEVFEQLLTWQSSKRRAANGQTFGISQRRTNQIWSGTYNLWQGTTFTHSCCKTNQIYPIISLSLRLNTWMIWLTCFKISKRLWTYCPPDIIFINFNSTIGIASVSKLHWKIQCTKYKWIQRIDLKWTNFFSLEILITLMKARNFINWYWLWFSWIPIAITVCNGWSNGRASKVCDDVMNWWQAPGLGKLGSARKSSI